MKKTFVLTIEITEKEVPSIEAYTGSKNLTVQDALIELSGNVLDHEALSLAKSVTLKEWSEP